MRPRAYIEIDDRPIAGVAIERLISCGVTLRDGGKADGFEIDFNAADAAGPNIAVPRKGSIAMIALGYGETFFGKQGTRQRIKGTIDHVTLNCLPYKITVSGSSADLRKGKLKEPKERHWDNKKVRDIFEDLAGGAGLELKISEKIGAHQYEWVGQLGESDIQFGERLARRLNALFSVKDGKMIVAERGAGEGVSGAQLGTAIITPRIIIPETCSFDLADRSKYNKVTAFYQDKKKAKRIEVDADSSAESDSVLRLRETFADAAEADKAAQAKAKQLKRGDETTSVTVIGDNTLIAGMMMKYRYVHPYVDNKPYIATEIKDTFSKSAGYRSALSGALHDGKSGSSAKKSK